MAKKDAPFVLRLNLLKPQGVPEKITIKFIRWLLTVGRFIIVFVEALVLVVFVSRFKFDSELETLKEDTESQIPYIESLKNDEYLIRQTQLQLSTIADKRLNYPNYTSIIKKISGQTPRGIKIVTLNINHEVNIKISGTATNNTDITSFVSALKADKTFTDVNLVSVGLDQGTTTFTINASQPPKFTNEVST